MNPPPLAAGGFGKPSITPAASNVRPTIVPAKGAAPAGRGKVSSATGPWHKQNIVAAMLRC